MLLFLCDKCAATSNYSTSLHFSVSHLVHVDLFVFFTRMFPGIRLQKVGNPSLHYTFYGRVVIDAHADSKINVQAAFSAATIGARNENFNQVSCHKVLIRCESLMLVLSFLYSPPSRTKCLPAIIKQLSLYN